MKKAIIISAILFGTIVSTAQEKCSKETIENLIQVKLTESKGKEAKSQEIYEEAVHKLAIKKGWDKEKKLKYLLDMVSTESFQHSTKDKYATLQEAMELLKKVDTIKATAGNCEVLASLEQKFDKVILSNQTEWEKVMAQINEDYKMVANRNVQTTATSSQDESEVISNTARPEALVGVWSDLEKEENYVFEADGVVYNQPYGTDILYNQRYWYVKEGKICFTFSDETEGGICIPYTVDDDGILSTTAFGETMKYKKK